VSADRPSSCNDHRQWGISVASICNRMGSAGQRFCALSVFANSSMVDMDKKIVRGEQRARRIQRKGR
jgi:hypothetical protein